jgi:HlyD family secretion protein
LEGQESKMRRVAVPLVVLVLVMSLVLAWRLRVQAKQVSGPTGGSGEVEGVEVNLSARIASRVVEQRVKKGDEVKRGDLLIVLNCDDAEAALTEAQGRMTAAHAQVVAARASVEASQRSREAAAATQLAAEAQAKSLAAQRDAALRQAGRLDSVSMDVTQSSRDQTRASAEGLAHQTEAAQAQARASGGQARAALASIRASGAQVAAAEAQMKVAEASASRAKLLVDECKVYAPRDAVVEDFPHEVGELVSAGQTLVKLVDLTEVKATFYVPNTELAAAKPGTRATIVADAMPARRLEGVVRTVSAQAEFTPRNIQTRTDRDRLVYPVEVWIRNDDRLLRPGMAVQVILAGGSR